MHQKSDYFFLCKMILFYYPLMSRKINFAMCNWLLYSDCAVKALLLCGNSIYQFLIWGDIIWGRILNLKEFGGGVKKYPVCIYINWTKKVWEFRGHLDKSASRMLLYVCCLYKQWPDYWLSVKFELLMVLAQHIELC